MCRSGHGSGAVSSAEQVLFGTKNRENGGEVGGKCGGWFWGDRISPQRTLFGTLGV